MEDRGIQLENIWTKPETLPLQLFKGILSILKNAATFNWAEIPVEAIDSIESIKHGTAPGKRGWQLISRALVKALLKLIWENTPPLGKEDLIEKRLDQQLNELLENSSYFINTDFFRNPGKLPLFNAARDIFKEFLTSFAFENTTIDNLLQRLPAYFTYDLLDEWRKNHDYYQELSYALNTPFDEAVKRETEWRQYNNWLNLQTETPIFTESFSLQQVYIPLRAFYIKKQERKSEHQIFKKSEEGDTHEKIVVDIESLLLQWINRRDKEDAIRVLRGGPGYGKSSLLKILAAKLANQDKKVLFIPLHRFDLKDDLNRALRDFLAYDRFLSFNPLDEKDTLIIFFDGLDELSMQGMALAEAASKFVQELAKEVLNYNARQLRLQVILSGRDIIIQQNEVGFRKEEQVLGLLPYFLPDSEKKEYTDPKQLLNTDQRNIWWHNYGKAKGRPYKELPAALENKELDELTAQPLLNYLVALSYERGKLTFDKETNLNEVYADLLEAVYERSYADGKRRIGIQQLDLNDFIRMMEEIAITAWQGNGRTTTVKEIENHFRESGMLSLLNRFVQDAEKGVVSLLVSFYFRQAGFKYVNGDETFEFTHKSFGEYLAARRITETLLHITNKFKANKKDLDDDRMAEKCLQQWIKLFGAKMLDKDLLKYIRNQIAIKYNTNPQLINDVQDTIIGFTNHVLHFGMPVETLNPRPLTYQEEFHLAQHAEIALLTILGTIASVTNIPVNINWPDKTFFRRWINRLIDQRNSPQNFFLKYLNHLNLSNSSLSSQDLFGANLSRANLSSANLSLADLSDADLSRGILSNVNLSKANLFGANLSKALLNGANLSEAILLIAIFADTNLSDAILVRSNLARADLSRADLIGADLSKANLSKANLPGAILIRADLSDANLSGADLSRTNLSEAILVGTDLSRTNLSGAILNAVNLSGANLSWVDLLEVNLSEANLERTILIGADLSGSNLERANLSKADLEGTNLSDANLHGANLSEANLERTNLPGAILTKAVLFGANLSRTYLRTAILSPEQKAYAKSRGAIVD